MAGRPLTLVHCPAGIAAPCNFLKHAKAWGPSALRRVHIQEKTKVGEYLVADSIEAVVSLAQMGIVEIHTWNSTADDVERPNRLVWDLDPGPEVSWNQVVKAAELVRDVLEDAAPHIMGQDHRRPRTACRRAAEAKANRRGVSRFLARRERSDREDGSADLYDSFRKGGTRAANSHRLSEKQPHQHVGLCVLPRARPGAAVSMPLGWNDLREPPGSAGHC